MGTDSEHLSDSEIEQIARELNAPILDAIQNPPEGFRSKLSFDETNLQERIAAINWFPNCGSPLDIELTMPVKSVDFIGNCGG